MPLPPLADLHRHLDGSLRESTLRELAARLSIDVPAQFRFRPGMGLAAALRCFDLSLALLQEPAAVRRVAAEICDDAEREGVTTLELRFAPQLHQGATAAAIVEAAAEGVQGRAGLVLCGLYGEDPSVLEGLVLIARSWASTSPAGRTPSTPTASATTRVRTLSPATSASAAPSTPAKAGRRPRSARRSSASMPSASATGRRSSTTPPCSTSCASGA